MVASPEPTERLSAESEPQPSLARLLRELKSSLGELGEYASYLISLELDRAKLSAKRIGFYAVLGVAGLAIATAFLAAGTGLLVLGLAGLIGMALGNFWLGAAIVGVGMFLVLGAGAWAGWRMLNKGAYKALRRKYAQRRERQKATFGRDVKEVARG